MAPPDFIASVPAQQLIGRKIQESFPPALAEQFLQLNQQALASQTVQVYEYTVPVGEETRWRETRIFATSTHEIIALVRDITRRKRAVEILLQSEDRYRKLIESLPDAILLYRSQQVLFSNPAGLRLWKAAEPSALVGKSLLELIHPTGHRHVQLWEELLLTQSEGIRNAPQQIVRLDGTVVDVEVTAVAYQDIDGIAVQAIYRDVTERKQAEVKNQQLLHEVAAQRSQLRALHVRLARIEENERKRLAHELHDWVAQNLTGLNLNLIVLQRHLQNEVATESRVHSRLTDAITIVEQTTVQIRKVMADLRPPVLDDYGLLATLEWYAAQIASNTGLRIEVLGEEVLPRPAEYVELTLFRIVQEALANVVQHALATQAMVVLTADDTSIYVTISDDGVGIEPTQPEPTTKEQKWGLITIRERAEAIGGRCQVESYPFLGTTVMVEVQR
jgi:two-component system, NarL family, sensor histidine kinase UhpB